MFCLLITKKLIIAKLITRANALVAVPLPQVTYINKLHLRLYINILSTMFISITAASEIGAVVNVTDSHLCGLTVYTHSCSHK